MLPLGTGAGALVRRSMPCLLGAGALWLGLPSVAGAQGGAAPPSTEEVILVHVCDDGMPDGWEVIEQGSSLGERVVVCNFTAAVSGDAVKAFDTLPSTITLFAPEDSVNGLPENINMQAAGVAITVEYYCTTTEAADRWEGLSGSPRDTEVPGTRTPDRVVLEEGRIASTEEGRQRGLIESIFMPGLFTLQEKSFLLLNEQTVATVVINTNSREISVRTSANEPGIADDLARTVSANHTPAATPDCNIPAVARPVGDPSTGAGNPAGAGGGKGGSGGRIGIVLGTGAAITVGGVLVWTRKEGRRRPPPPKLDQDVPPQCAGQLQQYEHIRERLLTLEEAFQDMNEHLQATQRKHHHNLLRTYTILGWELGTTMGGPAAGAYKFRPSGRRVIPLQADKWKPPLNLNPRLASALAQAQAALAAASARAAALRQTLANIASGVAKHPTVLAAQQKLTAFGHAVMKYSDDLAKCESIRKSLNNFHDLKEKARLSGIEKRNVMFTLESMENKQKLAIAELKDAISTQERKKGTLAMPKPAVPNPKDTRAVTPGQPAAPPGTPPMDPDVLAAKQQQLAGLERQQAETVKQLESARKVSHAADGEYQRLDGITNRYEADLARYGDITPAGVQKLREQHRAARQALDTAKLEAAGDMAARQKAAQEALRKAQIEEGLAKSFQEGLKKQAISGAAQAPGVARQVLHGGVWVASLPFTPILWLFEKGFGRVQSVPEAFEILRRGEERITELTHQLVMVERAITQQKVVAHRQRQMLDECIKQHLPKAPSKGAA